MSGMVVLGFISVVAIGVAYLAFALNEAGTEGRISWYNIPAFLSPPALLVYPIYRFFLYLVTGEG